MISTDLFKKFGTKATPVEPKPASTPEGAPAPEAAGPAADAPASVPSAAEVAAPVTPPAKQPATAPAAAPLRAARLVEYGTKQSSKLKARLAGASSKAEPWGKAAAAASLLVAAGALGYAGGLTAAQHGDKDDLAALRWSDAAAAMKDSREETARVATELKFVRIAVDGLKGDRSRSDLAGKQTQLSERLDRYATEMTGKIGKLSEQLDRVEKTQRDPARIASVVERLERIEKQVQTASAAPPPKPVAAAVPTPPAAPADVTTTGSLPDPRPPVKPAEVDHRKVQVEGFILRDIDDGLALVEARNGRYYEVSPGMTLPGLGKVEAIERRGRQWVVVTPKGYIGER